MRITRVLAAECSLPLPRPIRLGPVEIKTREFVALRLETDTGLFGDALGYPRGGPLPRPLHWQGRLRRRPNFSASWPSLRRKRCSRPRQMATWTTSTPSGRNSPASPSRRSGIGAGRSSFTPTTSTKTSGSGSAPSIQASRLLGTRIAGCQSIRQFGTSAFPWPSTRTRPPATRRTRGSGRSG